MDDRRTRVTVLLRLAPVLAAASFIASWIVNWSVILPYQNREAFWGSGAWQASLLATQPSAYTDGVLLNWLTAGVPAATLSLVAVLILHPDRRRRFIVAMLVGPALMVVPAWWSFAWFGAWYLASAAAVISACVASLVFLGAATLVGCVPPNGRSQAESSARH